MESLVQIVGRFMRGEAHGGTGEDMEATTNLGQTANTEKETPSVPLDDAFGTESTHKGQASGGKK